MFEDILQTFWVVVGAFSGVAIGLTFEGADFLASLRSVKGWQQIYHGTTHPKAKKIDNGGDLAEPAPTAGAVISAISCDSLLGYSVGMRRRS